MPLWPNKHGVQEYFAYYRNSSEPTGSGTFLSFEAKIQPNLTSDCCPLISVYLGRALAAEGSEPF